MLKETKRKYLENELWILTFAGGFQRASVYKTTIKDEKVRAEFRAFIKTTINDLFESSYKNKACTSEQHIKNLQKLKKKIDRKYSSILAGGEIKLGIVQKLLNLYLKYKWCSGLCPTPPHCPFDRIIINKLGMALPPNWTSINDIATYKTLVKYATDKANQESIKSIAEWELLVFNRR